MDLKCNQKSMISLHRSLPEVPCGPVIRERRYGSGDAIGRLSLSIWAAFIRAERIAIGWMSRHSLSALRIGLGIIYLWFGALKLFPSLSPAEEIVTNTFRFLNAEWLVPCLGAGEVAIGLSLVFGVFMRVSLPILFMHMSGTVLPLFLLPQETWTSFPFAPTLEGQYIVKNIVIVGAACVLGGSMRWRLSAPLSRAPMEAMEAMPPSGNGMRIR
jgi:uncharacterized membrane protein YphA (DoxX/SURF4 family)